MGKLFYKMSCVKCRISLTTLVSIGFLCRLIQEMKNLIPILLIFGLTTLGCKKDLVDTSANNIEDVLEDSSFESKIAEGTTVAFFHASWCSSCEQQRPAVEQASEKEELSFATFIEVEYDDSREIFDSQNVGGFPQILIYKNGVEQERLIGKGHSVSEIIDAVLKYKD